MNYTVKKLREHRYAQCEVVKYNTPQKDICFYSYNTPVIQIKYLFGKRYVLCTGTYSQTTRKQIGWFLREYAPDLNYYDMKKISGKNKFTIM